MEEHIKKLCFWSFIFLVVGLFLGYGIALRYSIYTPDNIGIMQENSALLANYMEGFQYCDEYCNEMGKVGYIRAITNEHHSCFCYNNSVEDLE